MQLRNLETQDSQSNTHGTLLLDTIAVKTVIGVPQEMAPIPSFCISFAYNPLRGGRNSSPGRFKIFHFPITSRSGLGLPTYYTKDTGRGGLSRGIKRPGREADQSPPTSAKVRTMWIDSFTPPYVFMAQRLIS
jgi:hypothetical protein